MTTGDQISELIRASFPVDPLPDEFWLADVIRRPLDDIAEELQNRIAERSWPEITIRDWALIGASPDVVRRYLTPNAFRYYLPSSLVGVLRDIGYVELALDSILPNNQKRCPKGVVARIFERLFCPAASSSPRVHRGYSNSVLG
jgi:hypothetical protein